MQKRIIDVAVLSDLHLGTYGCRAKEILTYLKSINPQLLILNGDIIDVWQLSKRYFPLAHVAVIKEILNLVTTGTKVIYVTGNHDEMLRRYSDLQLGQFQLVDKLIIEIDHKMTWIFHGDAFDNATNGSAKFWAKLGSNGYALLLGFNRFVNKLMKLAGRQQLSFSKKIMLKVSDSFSKIESFENLVGELAIQKKYDYVICGHIHQPQKRLIQRKEGSVVYLNSGDWVEHLSALEYYNNDWHIYHHELPAMQTSNVRTIPQENAHVPLNELAILLQSLATK